MFEKIILHVGLHKTGTTSLQNYFGNNREKLKSLGVVYPQLCINDFIPNNHSWPILNITLSDPSNYHLNITNGFSGAKLTSIIHSIEQQLFKLKDAEEKILLISGEGISTLKKSELEVLRNKLYKISNKQVDFGVHYFNRNVNSYIDSVIQQRLKGGTRENIIFQELALRSPFNNFLNLKSFENVFSKSVIKEHFYEDACSWEGGLENYFSQKILKQQRAFNVSANRVNSSLSHISFQLIRHYINYSKVYVRVPLKGTNYSENIKVLSLIPGEKFSLTAEQKNRLIKFINKSEYATEWESFLQNTEFLSEKNCWLTCKFDELEKKMDLLDSECQQVLVDLLRDMAVSLEKLDIKISLTLMYLAHKYRTNGKFILNKIKEYNVKINDF